MAPICVQNIALDSLGRTSQAFELHPFSTMLEMTLEEYEKVLEERKTAFQALKTKERKVDTKEFESMQALSSKKWINDSFAALMKGKDWHGVMMSRERKKEVVKSASNLGNQCLKE
ncbi:hypothetical protein JHK85_010349 [Glycine max]|nr:hypothetical protein JHK85_010349 [Glycine max]